MDDLIDRTRMAAKILRDIGGQSAMAATVDEAADALEAVREEMNEEKRRKIAELERRMEAVESFLWAEAGYPAYPIEGVSETEDALEAAREDAARYRWLRDEARTNRVPHIFQYPPQSFDRPQYPHFKDVGLDAAIDAARKEAPID